jgi:hypothetical protein
MQTPPPLPPPLPRKKSNLRKVILFALLALTCVGAAIYTLLQNQWEEEQVSSKRSVAARTPAFPIPLREIDVDKLVTQYIDKQDYFHQLEAATLAEYDRTNQASQSWFAEGRQAARLFTAVVVWNDFYGQGLLQTADAYAAAAWKKGCRDPLIESICDVYTFQNRHSNNLKGAQTHIRNTRNLLASKYPALFKFVATGVVLKNLIYSKSDHGDLKEELGVAWAEIPKFVPAVREQYAAILKEDPPADLLFYRTGDLFDQVEDGECLLPIGNEIEAAFNLGSPNHPARAAIRGDFLMTWAWQARGSGWANTVTEQGWRDMADRLEQASKVLTDAYTKNPGDYLSATVMIGVELGQGNGRAVMETWFERAMKGHPNNFAACVSKGWYLQPRWHGSPEDEIQFGLECVKTGNWKAKIPTVLLTGIGDLADDRDDVYRNDEVWKLVSPVYEEFLKRYPDSIAFRTSYADCAARGGRIDVLRAQLALLGTNWDRSEWSDADYRRVSALAKKP